jgi:transcription initiation factor TFIIH subunit 4
MAMLFMPTPFAVSDFETWVKPDTDSVRASGFSINILTRLKVLEETRNDQNRPAYQLNKAFQRSLRLALTGGGDHRSFGVPSSTPDKNEVTIDFLDTYARQQWESILYYVVGSAGQGLGSAVNITAGTKELLESGGFVMSKGRNAYITRDGFSFLLQETNAQIWTLLIEYLKLSEKLQMDAVDVLSFLFTLGSLELGVSYTTENLTPTQAHMLEDLSDFGVIYRRASDTSRYYPTRLATTLTSDSPALLNTSMAAASLSVTPTTTTTTLAPLETEKGYIIVETNYRIYAYTSSPLNISILSLFANLKTRFPNMLTATLTKSSIQQAIAAGITADQIITYLTTHAHPILRKSTPILPPTVVDQIRLWQLENERMKATPGYLIRDVGTQEEYLKAVQHADTIGVLTWQNDAKGMFFVTKFDQMAQYFKAIARRRREDDGEDTPR